jgi:hypothetical protein
MKNVVAIIIILIGLAGGILLYAKVCRSGPSPETIVATRKADSALHALDSTQAAVFPIIALLRQDTAHKARIIDSLKQEKASLEKEQSDKGSAIFQTLDQGDSAVAQADTAAIIDNWIKLSGAVRDIAPVIRSKDSVTQAVIDQCFELGKVKDSIAAHWEGLYYVADTTARLQKQANVLLKRDFDRQQFQVKIWKPVAIGGVSIVVLDFIIHSLKK